MNDFLLDLWNDLREKRLWPVAGVLLLALVALPVVLAKPAEEPGSATPPAAAAQRGVPEREDLRGLAAVELADEPPGSGSTLGVFDPNDPFKPPARAIAEESSGAADSTAAGPSADGSDQGTSSDADTSGGGGSTDGTTGGTTGGTGGGTKAVEYKYVVDASFVANGRKRRIKGMERLDVLPSQANPLLIFLGASSGGGNAVFLVDSTLTAAGEGKCKPSQAECAFLHLGAGSEEEFVNEEGDSYTLRVDQIRKVKVDSDPAREARASGPADAEVAERRFVPPLIADLVSVSSSSDESSDAGQTGR
jgi:hypothetical protein